MPVNFHIDINEDDKKLFVKADEMLNHVSAIIGTHLPDAQSKDINLVLLSLVFCSLLVLKNAHIIHEQNNSLSLEQILKDQFSLIEQFKKNFSMNAPTNH